MTAYASVYGCDEAFAETAETDLPKTGKDAKAIDVTTGSDTEKVAKKLQLKAVARHKKMNAFLQSACLDHEFELVNECCTPDWPLGDCSLLLTKLTEKHQPQDQMAVVQQQTALIAVSMKSNDDPRVLSSQFAKAQAISMKDTIPEKTKIAMIIEKSPKLYNQTIHAEKDRLVTASEPVTSHKLLEKMHELWRMNGGKNQATDSDSDSDSGKEFALGTFPGKCFKCNEVGHKAFECPKKKDLSHIECYECGKRGHYARNCWEKEINKNKRPEGWKSSKENEVSGAAVTTFELII